MPKEQRSTCPINLSLEVFGDRWSLLILRDIAFTGLRYFRELLTTEERVSSSVLSDRLNNLVAHGLLTRSDDAGHRQKIRYNLTEASIQLVPVLTQLTAWGVQFLPADPRTGANALLAGGPEMMEQFLDELRAEHLGPSARLHPAPAGPTVADQLEAVYQAGG